MIGDIFIIIVILILEWREFKKRKDKRIKWEFEILYRVLIPIGIATAWIFCNILIFSYEVIFDPLMNPLWIILLPIITSSLIYIFHYSEFWLMSNFETSGNKLTILNFHEEEPMDNYLNVYYESHEKIINVEDSLQEHIAKIKKDIRNIEKKLGKESGKKELESLNEKLTGYNDLAKAMKDYYCIRLYLNLQDFIGDEFKKLTQIYYCFKPLEENEKELGRFKGVLNYVSELSKVVHLNCVELEPIVKKGKDFSVIIGFAGARCDKLLKEMKLLANSLEKIKILPETHKIEILELEKMAMQEEINDLREFIKDTLDKKQANKIFKHKLFSGD